MSLWEKRAACRASDAVRDLRSGIDIGDLELIGELLCGKVGGSGLEWERPPHKLLLWLEGGLLKFVFMAKDTDPKLWGTSKGLAEGLLGIENALAKEQCEWKYPKSNGHVLTPLKR